MQSKYALPNENLLMSLFCQFNRIYWDNSLPGAMVKWNHYLMNAGRCYPEYKTNGDLTYEIVLSFKYHMLYPHEVIPTLKHEMIHIIIPDHNEQFAREAIRIGTRIHSYLMKLPNRYKYRCPDCESIFYDERIRFLARCPFCREVEKKAESILEFVGMRSWEMEESGESAYLCPA